MPRLKHGRRRRGRADCKQGAFQSQSRGRKSQIDAKSKEDSKAGSRIYEVLVVGAGPSSLACVSGLLEPYVQSTLAYDHDKEMLDKSHGGSATSSQFKTSTRKDVRVLKQRDICIVDASSSSWLGRWKSYFGMLEIPRLRSIMVHHPDPYSEDALLEYCILQKNMRVEDCGAPVDHLFEEGSSRRERKKSRTVSRIRQVNNTDRFKFIRPRTDLYHQFCDQVVNRYHLNDSVVKGSVIDVVPEPMPPPQPTASGSTTNTKKSRLLRVHLRDGSTILARNVVLAVGNTCVPRIPAWAEGYRYKMNLADASSQCEHVWDLAKKGSKYLSKKIRGRRVLVVGGGLTAVQSAQKCIREGAKSVVLMARKNICTRDFAVPVSWFGSTRNAEMCKFLQTEDPAERLKLIQDVRGPATVPRLVLEEFRADLRRHPSANVMERHEVSEVDWDAKTRKWTVVYRNLDSTSSTEVEDESPSATSNFEVDYILLATGAEISWKSHPLLRKIAGHTKPGGTAGGLPVLTADLRWQEGLNLFITGGYAALQLGPAAATLAGARRGASLLRDAILIP